MGFLRYYQEIAVRNAMEAIANKKDRVLLTLATGTGKTAIAFQIAWRLWNSKEQKPKYYVKALLLSYSFFSSYYNFPSKEAQSKFFK